MSLGFKFLKLMKFSIIGTGFIFPSHVQAIKSIGGKIVEAIGEGSSLSWQEIIKNHQTDCIVILSPNNFHFEMAKLSAQCGKIVLCEKPLTIKSKEARILMKYPNIFTVCQLRYHPLVEKIKSEIKKDKNYQIEMDISVHRDESYWKSWKGMSEISGGILFNLGIHCFDLLLYLFGPAQKIQTSFLTGAKGEGIIEGKNYFCQWRINAEEEKENQKRVFKINGASYNFSSAENLHIYVYKDLLENKGIAPKDALSSIELVEKIYRPFAK